MAAALILWAHAFAALLFGWLAITAWRDPAPRRALAVALAATATAALALAGLGVNDPGVAAAEAIRDLAWTAALLIVVRRCRAGQAALSAIAASVAICVLAALAVAIVAGLPVASTAADEVFATGQAVRMVALAGGLVLVRHAASTARRAGDPRATAGLLALALLWGGELVAAAAAWSTGAWTGGQVAARGLLMLGAAIGMAAAVHHRRETLPAMSRQITERLIAAVALVAYLAVVAVASGLAARLGSHARIAQVAVAIGAGAALMTLVATPWLRAWARVKLSKHLFRHRYDYRVEWQRFTAALGGSDPMGERVVRAIAGFTDSPGGLLLIADEGRLVPDIGWRWAGPVAGGNAALARQLGEDWVVELDRLRAQGGGEGPGRDTVPPAWLAAEDAWVAVPLVHDGVLTAAVLLARPPVTRALDWEDFDLLRLAGRQAASHLAEDRARAELAEARRFDEFNRRFAFIMHDLKNLVSQMTLTASNARRHADNPAFRADMVATLGDCAERMTALIARLQSHGEQPCEPLVPMNAAAAARRAAARFGPDAVRISDDAPLAMAHPARLEQVLGHLIQNALEAGGAGAPVEVTLASHDGGVAIAVSDRGCGMTPGFVRDQLFRPFASSKPGGFGLGAFEARQLVRGMGGTMEVESRVGEGTCFRILLPRAAAMEHAA